VRCLYERYDGRVDAGVSVKVVVGSSMREEKSRDMRPWSGLGFLHS
jgi:hypothetical protein